MNAYTAVCIINTAIILAIAVACYASGSGLPLFALLFLMSTETKSGKCSCDDKRPQQSR